MYLSGRGGGYGGGMGERISGGRGGGSDGSGSHCGLGSSVSAAPGSSGSELSKEACTGRSEKGGILT